MLQREFAAAWPAPAAAAAPTTGDRASLFPRDAETSLIKDANPSPTQCARDGPGAAGDVAGVVRDDLKKPTENQVGVLRGKCAGEPHGYWLSGVSAAPCPPPPLPVRNSGLMGTDRFELNLEFALSGFRKAYKRPHRRKHMAAFHTSHHGLSRTHPLRQFLLRKAAFGASINQLPHKPVFDGRSLVGGLIGRIL